jgi:hypothetical protein
MMDFDKHIDAYVNSEKGIAPSPFLQARVMARVSSAPGSFRKFPLWQPVAVAASLAAVVVCGFLIGSVYDPSHVESGGMAVNDSQIENFIILTADVDQ